MSCIYCPSMTYDKLIDVLALVSSSKYVLKCQVLALFYLFVYFCLIVLWKTVGCCIYFRVRKCWIHFIFVISGVGTLILKGRLLTLFKIMQFLIHSLTSKKINKTLSMLLAQKNYPQVGNRSQGSVSVV